jgi:hypothetical protein
MLTREMPPGAPASHELRPRSRPAGRDPFGEKPAALERRQRRRGSCTVMGEPQSPYRALSPSWRLTWDDPRATSDGEGRFRVEGAPPWQPKVEVWADVGPETSAGKALIEHMPAPGQNLFVELSMKVPEASGPASGRIIGTLRVNGEPLRGRVWLPSREPARGQGVFCRDTQDPLTCLAAETDDEGRYELRVPAGSGTYDLFSTYRPRPSSSSRSPSARAAAARARGECRRGPASDPAAKRQ